MTLLTPSPGQYVLSSFSVPGRLRPVLFRADSVSWRTASSRSGEAYMRPTLATVDGALAARLQPSPDVRDLAVAVVIPAFNERRANRGTVPTVPDFVDRVLTSSTTRPPTNARRRGRAHAPRAPARVEVLPHPGERGRRRRDRHRATGGAPDRSAPTSPPSWPATVRWIRRPPASSIRSPPARPTKSRAPLPAPRSGPRCPPSRIVGNVLSPRHARDLGLTPRVRLAVALHRDPPRRPRADRARRAVPAHGYPNDLLSGCASR